MIIDIFPTQIICFNFNKHTKYFFRDPGKVDNTPAGWKCKVNSTFPHIPDDDALVTPDVRDRLKIDIETACNAELVREGLMPCNIVTFWYNSYHDDQSQERHDHMDGRRPVFLLSLIHI